MTHFGIISVASTGPLNTMLSLGQELQRRGHLVTFFGILDTERKAKAAGLKFQAIGEKEFPLGATQKFFIKLGKLSGLKALKYTIELLKETAYVMLKYAPDAMKKAGVEAVLVNQSAIEGGTVADRLHFPFVTVCSAVVLNREAGVPPFNTPWNYSPTWLARKRNQMGYSLLNSISKPIRDVISAYRKEWNLPHFVSINDY